MTENSRLQFAGIVLESLGWGIKNDCHILEIMACIYDDGLVDILHSDKFMKLANKIADERLKRAELKSKEEIL